MLWNQYKRLFHDKYRSNKNTQSVEGLSTTKPLVAALRESLEKYYERRNVWVTRNRRHGWLPLWLPVKDYNASITKAHIELVDELLKQLDSIPITNQQDSLVQDYIYYNHVYHHVLETFRAKKLSLGRLKALLSSAVNDLDNIASNHLENFSFKALPPLDLLPVLNRVESELLPRIPKMSPLHTELCLLKDKWRSTSSTSDKQQVSGDSYNYLRKLLLLERYSANEIHSSQIVIQILGESFGLTREQTKAWQHFKRHSISNPRLCPIRDLTASSEKLANVGILNAVGKGLG
jgi:hypothetical protein